MMKHFRQVNVIFYMRITCASELKVGLFEKSRIFFYYFVRHCTNYALGDITLNDYDGEEKSPEKGPSPAIGTHFLTLCRQVSSYKSGKNGSALHRALAERVFL